MPPPCLVSMVVGDSLKVGDVCKLLNDVLWESPPPRDFVHSSRQRFSKETAKIVFMMQSQATATANQTSVWRACEIELTVIYTSMSLSMAMNRSKELAK